MSAPAQTRIFGIRLGLDPKILVGGLIAFAALLFWYNSRGDDSDRPTAAATPRVSGAEPAIVTPSGAKRSAVAARRRSANRSDGGTLRLRTIDATRGDIDPELRLDLLASLHNVKLPAGSRDLFEDASVPGMGPNGMPVPVRKIVPTALPAQPITSSYPLPTQLMANIPYKYYGFVKPHAAGEGNRGFFMDGDKVLVGVEGQLLADRYLVVQLSPASARMQDTQIKKEQTLPLVPEAAAGAESSGFGYGSPAGFGGQAEVNEEAPQEQEPVQPIQPGRFGPGIRPPIRGGFISPNGPNQVQPANPQ